jgi:diketogulonate reductase-like aldo/keto reductase
VLPTALARHLPVRLQIKVQALKYGGRGEQIAFAFLMAKGLTGIPSSAKNDCIASNFEASRITMSPTEFKRIKSREKGMRLMNGAWRPVWDSLKTDLGTSRKSRTMTVLATA